MRKTICFCLCMLFAATSFAQFSWNAKIGLNISNWTGDGDTDARAGFKVGVGMEYAFTDMWLLQPSFYYSVKGAKNIHDFEVADYVGGDPSVSQRYLELPVMGAARFMVSDNINMVVSAGPYFACGVGGKIKGESYTARSEDTKIDTFGSNRLNRFDTGMGIGVAAELSRLIIGLEGQVGFVKLVDHYNSRNLNFSVMVGMKF